MNANVAWLKFERDLDKAIQVKWKNPIRRFFREVALTLWGYIIVNSETAAGQRVGSPVLTGRFYASHNISLNVIETKERGPNPSGASSPYPQLGFSDAKRVLAKWKPGDTVYISNSVPYGRKLESQHWSKKTPYGIYMVAVNAVRAKFAGRGRFTFKGSI